MKGKIKAYAVSILFTLAVGAVSAFLTRNNMDVYSNIQKPGAAPPGIVLPIVWTVLYILMGTGLANVIIKGREKGIYTMPAVYLYLLQLAVNFLWSLIFFNLQAFLFAFVWLLILWVLVGAMILKFHEISPFAAYINIPYFAWVTFAGYLNYMVYSLNA